MNTASLTGDFDGFPLSSAPQILTMGHCTSDLWILCSQFKNIPPFSLLFPHSPTPLPLSVIHWTALQDFLVTLIHPCESPILMLQQHQLYVNLHVSIVW